MTKLKLMFMALMIMAPAVSALAQADDRVITVDDCRAHVAQHGVPDADPVVAFQGGSLETQVVAFCQSLAYRGECDGVGLDLLAAILILADARMALRQSP